MPASAIGTGFARMFELHPAGHERAGQTVSRDMICVCGTPFTQQLLGAFWRDKAWNPMLPQDVRVPDGYVPRYCPTCESRELGRLALNPALPFLADRERAA